ncbi:Hypothetical Protein FCC1311_070422 [Hondaea fermentalgiana]|uniref:Uncharacterized protein n=1 Tax=Hondaea fermentalgiana TaxID=2315210 RepID=A0A2R5GIV4_9STRA|nr:Hypothetical Protein FCC1311_070422 [Hondaea fermentalgiana]|eukprot:GBG30822.1 Hypothetical Protein FCC1311_070422 [Hondaea fermentalgiana]
MLKHKEGDVVLVDLEGNTSISAVGAEAIFGAALISRPQKLKLSKCGLCDRTLDAIMTQIEKKGHSWNREDFAKEHNSATWGFISVQENAHERRVVVDLSENDFSAGKLIEFAKTTRCLETICEIIVSPMENVTLESPLLALHASQKDTPSITALLREKSPSGDIEWAEPMSSKVPDLVKEPWAVSLSTDLKNEISPCNKASAHPNSLHVRMIECVDSVPQLANMVFEIADRLETSDVILLFRECDRSLLTEHVVETQRCYSAEELPCKHGELQLCALHAKRHLHSTRALAKIEPPTPRSHGGGNLSPSPPATPRSNYPETPHLKHQTPDLPITNEEQQDLKKEIKDFLNGLHNAMELKDEDMKADCPLKGHSKRRGAARIVACRAILELSLRRVVD